MKLLLIALLICLPAALQAQQKKAFIDSVKVVVLEEAKPVYVKCHAQVANVRTKIEQAKSKTIPASKAVAYYNEIFGDIMGKSSTLSEAEKVLNEKGSAYIEIMYLKEQSRIFLLKSAEYSYKEKSL